MILIGKQSWIKLDSTLFQSEIPDDEGNNRSLEATGRILDILLKIAQRRVKLEDGSSVFDGLQAQMRFFLHVAAKGKSLFGPFIFVCVIVLILQSS